MTVNPVNDAPVVVDDVAQIDEDSDITLDVLANDSDAENDVLTISAASADVGTVNIVNNMLAYSPQANYFGTVLINYSVEDGQGGLSSGQATLTVNSVNDLPVVNDDNATTDEEKSVTVNVLSNDTDSDGDTLTISAVTASSGSVSIVSNQIKFIPANNATGNVVIDYTVTDGNSGTATGVLNITVNPLNDNPIAVADSATTNEDTLVIIDVLANDTDVDGDALSIATASSASGTVSIVDNQLHFTPSLNSFGTKTVNYSISDGNGGVSNSVVSIVIFAVNDSPIANNDIASLNEDTQITIDALANDSDLDGDVLTIVAASATNGEVSIVNNQLLYQTAANFNGTDSINYTISDGIQQSSATVSLNINALNDIPVAVGESVTLDEDSSLTIDVLVNDSDVDGDNLSLSFASANQGSVVILNEQLVYTAPVNYFGSDSIFYSITDGEGGFASATVNISVNAINDVPVAQADSVTTNEDVSITIDVLNNDTDIDGDSLTITSATAVDGNVVIQGNTLLYTPQADFHGTTTLTYAISDGQGGSATQNVDVTVVSINDLPVALDDTLTTNEDTENSLDVLANDSDPDGDGLSLVSASATKGTVTFLDGIITYLPAANDSGTDTISYNIEDGNGGSASALVNVVINAVNDQPIALPDSAITDEDTVVTISVLANDTDADNDDLSISSATVSSGAVSISSGQLVYQPATNFNGTEQISYSIDDGNGGTASSTVTVVVNAINDIPVAQNDTFATDEDVNASLDVLLNDSDVETTTLILTSVSAVSGSVSIVNNQISYQPLSNFNGTDSLSYTVEDGEGGSATASVTVTVNAINDAPIANQDNATVAEDTLAVIDVLVNDTDIDGDTLAITAASAASGSVSIVAGNLQYQANANFFGTDTITYSISDGNGGTANGTVALTITAVNDAPVGVNDVASMAEDGLLLFDVLANDTDVENETLSLQSVNASSGIASINSNQIQFEPSTNLNGVFTVNYTLVDASGAIASAQLDVTVTPVNDAPIAVADSVSIDEDNNITIDVLANDSDVEGDALTITSVSASSGSASIVNNKLEFVPQVNFNGPVNLSYIVQDAGGATASAEVDITINAVNDAPVAVDDSSSTSEDVTKIIDVIANDSDADGDALTITEVTASIGTVNIVNNQIQFIPPNNINGSASIDYTIEDGQGSSASAVLTVTIGSVNDMPIAQDDSATINEDQAVTLDVLANDSDPDGDSLNITQATANNATVIINNNQLEITPELDFNGSITINYTIDDGNSGTDSATVNLTVNAVNDLPIATSDNVTTAEDTQIIIDVLANDSDVDGDSLSIASVDASLGTANIVNNKIEYTPALNATGLVTLNYSISDGNGGSANSTVDIDVGGVNDNPVANDDNLALNEDTVTLIDVLANDTDADGNSLVIVSASASTGTATIAANKISYTPVANSNGSATINYTISDGSGGTDTATVNLTINPVNDHPVAVLDTVSVDEDTQITIDVLANDTDVENDALTITTATSSSGTLSIVDNKLDFTPVLNDSSAVTISYDISDGNGGSASGSVNITVNALNDVPVVLDESVTTNEDTAITVNVLSNDSDVDGDSLTLASVSSSTGVASIVSNQVRFIPAADSTTPTVVTYTVEDGNGGAVNGNLTVNINALNDSPVAVSDAVNTLEDTSITIDVLSNDLDVDGDTLTITSATASTGNVIIDNGQLVYTPLANVIGSVTINYSISDGNGGADSSLVNLIIDAVNDNPNATPDTFATAEDTAISLDVLSNDFDIDGDSISISSASAVSGNVAIVDNQLLYTPVSNQFGTDSISYSISDGNGGSANSSVAMTINAVNDNPLANTDAVTTNEDSVINIDAISNDTDIDGDALTIVSAGASNGSVSIVNNQLVYTPNLNFVGADTLTYSISDGNGGTANSTVGVTINAVNDNPVATADTVSTDEDTLLIIDALANDTDIDGDSLSISTASASIGTVVISGNQLQFTPALNSNAVDSISYSITDGNGATANGTVTISINPINDNPVAVVDSAAGDEDTSIIIDAILNDTDVDGDVLSLTSVNASSGSVSIVNNKITYLPTVNFNGNDTISYVISDSNGGTANGSVDVTINPVNDAPVANSDVLALDEDATVNIDVLANDTDIDGDTLTITSANATSGNVIVVNNQLQYTPPVDFNGTDSLSYTISDGNSGTANSTVALTINAVNDAPVAVNDTISLDEDSSINIDVLGNDSDVDGDVISISSASATSGSVSIVSGQLQYSPSPNFNGSDIISYSISDGNQGTANAQVNVTVNAINDTPVANGDTYSIDEDLVLNAATSLLANDSDVDNDTLTVNTTPIVDVASGSLTLSANGLFTYTPDANFSGVDSFSYQVLDGNGGSHQAAVVINVNPINDAPSAIANAYTLDEDVVLSVQAASANDLLDNDSDLDGDTLTVNTTPLVNVSNGILSLNADGSFVYTPNANVFGNDSFTYQISDGNGGTAQATVSLTINPINDAPNFNDATFSIAEDANNGVSVGNVNASDLENNAITYSLIGGDTGLFNINSTTGEITVNGATPFNFELQTVHSLSIDATDNGSPSMSDVATITVNITDVLEPQIPVQRATFGTSGTQGIELTGENTDSIVYDSIRDGDKIYFVGSVENYDRDIYMYAYHKNGSVDSGFGNAGELVIDLGADEEAKAIAEKGGKYYLAINRFDGQHTEICFIEINGNGELQTDNGINGVSCTNENSDLSVNDMVYDGSNFFAVGRKRTTTDDMMMIELDASLVIDTASPVYIDIGGLSLDDEATAIAKIDGDKKIITGSLVSAAGDKDVFFKHIDKDGLDIATFNNGNPVIIDIESQGRDDVMLAIGGKTESSFTAFAGGYTVLANGQKEAAIIAVDNTGALVSTVDADGMALYDFDGDAGSGTGYSQITGIEYASPNIYASGYLYDGNYKMFAARLNSLTAVLDTTYASGSGYIKTAFNSDPSYAHTLSVDSNDTAWVAGYKDDVGDSKVIMMAIEGGNDDAGELYDEFSTNGKRVINKTSSNSVDEGVTVLELKNSTHAGKILLASRVNDGSYDSLVLSRYLTGGTLDSAFGYNGYRQLSFTFGQTVTGMLEQSDGKVLLFGYIENAVGDVEGFIARTTADGELDTSFAGVGFMSTTDFSGSDDVYLESAVLDANEKVVAVGRTENGSTTKSFIMRVNPDGSLDTDDDSYDAAIAEFTNYGYIEGEDTDEYLSVAIDSNGAIFAAGAYTFIDKDHLIHKYTPAGLLDATFAASGTLVVDMLLANNDSASKILLDSSDNLIVVGNVSGLVNQVSVMKYDNTGSAITSFSGDGKAIYTLSSAAQNSYAYDALLDSNQELIIAGYGESLAGREGLLARIKPSGLLDSFFNNNGYFEASGCSNNETFNAMTLLNDQEVIVTGYCDSTLQDKNLIIFKYGFWEDGIEQ
ncbi:Ig-like domain-containing protein [Catenovulum sediminis]|uniref:Ig-like domain-containing protein n=1 Tax=Catenovulum sediminis TaxID=1740262 RepID=A0ABV1RGB9_9ALTE